MQSTRHPRRHDTQAGRFYEIDGRLLPSVTTILGACPKPALIPWAANQERTLVSETAADLYAEIPRGYPRSWYLATLHARLGTTRQHERTRDAAATIGLEAHRLIEWALRRAIGAEAGDQPIVSDAAWRAGWAFLEWGRAVALKPVLIEATVYSLKHDYAGTADLVARVDGVLTLLDFKTGKAIYPEAQLQSSAYRVALAEMGYLSLPGLIIRLPKLATDPPFDASRDVQAAPPASDLFPTFQAVHQVWTWQQAQQKSRARRTKELAS